MTSYATCCQRDNSTIHKSNAEFNRGFFNYVANELAYLRPNSLCQGPAPMPGAPCGYYGGVRQTINTGGPDTAKRAVLFQRSNYSSGCPANDVTLEPEVWDETRQLSPEQQLVMNRGMGLSPYWTRDFQVNSQLFESNILANYRSIPNREATGFQGFWPMPGMGQPTRQQSTCQVGSRFIRTKDVGPSKASYGSYGVGVLQTA